MYPKMPLQRRQKIESNWLGAVSDIPHIGSGAGQVEREKGVRGVAQG